MVYYIYELVQVFLFKRLVIMIGSLMGQIRFKKLLSFLAVGLILFLGIGSGHLFLMQQAASSHSGMQMNHKSECQSICSPLLNQKLQSPQAEEDDADPNPIYSQLNNSLIFTNLTYSLVLAVLLWSFLRRRPPDLTLLYGNFRN